jgi:hypothetical protein
VIIMNDEIHKAVQKSRAASQIAHPQQRNSFKALLLTNPNYFGNLSSSPFKPVLPISGNMHYEELGCVGYHPQQQKLEGIVYVYQTSGYGSGICGAGSTEFVRFYLSFDNGANWVDQGMTSFQAYDIAAGTEGSKRLEYAVSLPATPPRKFCFIGNHLIRVRAILSWNNPPPPNQPNWVPVWGNAREATIQVEPRRLFFPVDLLQEAKVKLPPGIGELLDLDEPIAPKQKLLGAQELAIAYKDKGVPMHRFAFKELSAFAAGKTALSAELLQQQLPQLPIDPSIIDVLFPKTDGDISFEELTCIGLDPNSPDTLVGIIKVKKSSGYSGGPCTQGSREYVSWWADVDDNGSFETFLGTAEVRVYDLDNIPSEGVHYAVWLPVDLGKYRKDCHAGPVVLKIRATLSWNSPVPGNTPNHVPTWGNREETLIHVAPTTGVPAGRISHIGSVLTPFIDDVTGLTLTGAQFAHNGLTLPDTCPFARRVTARFRVGGVQVQGRSSACRCRQRANRCAHSRSNEPDAGTPEPDHLHPQRGPDDEAVRIQRLRRKYQHDAGALGHHRRRPLAGDAAGLRLRQQPGRPARQADSAVAQQRARCVQGDDLRGGGRLRKIPGGFGAARQFRRPGCVPVRLQPDDRPTRECRADRRTGSAHRRDEHGAAAG